MEILKKLQQKGFRITTQRKNVLESLYTKPVTVEEIFDELKRKRVKIDLTSLYRTLQLFTNQGIIQKIDFGDGKTRYELVNENKHHHHLICDSCGTIEDIKLKDEEALLDQVALESQFQISNHTLEFFGQCKQCQ